MQVDWTTLGLACRRVEASPMPQAHRHHEVELNLLERGAATYLLGGATVRVEAGRLAVFWASVPHQVVAVEGGGPMHWLTVPLAAFLRFGLPAGLADRVLHGQPILSDATDADLDRRLFERWATDLESGSPERREIVLLEVEARLRRLGLQPDQGEAPARTLPAGRPGTRLEHAGRMAAFVARHHAGPIRVSDAARAAGLRPSQAMSVFRATFGLSVGEYLTRHRIAHAQRLLATTDLPVLDVAAEAGFGSASRFHEAFRRECGLSPRRYRQRYRSPAG